MHRAQLSVVEQIDVVHREAETAGFHPVAEDVVTQVHRIQLDRYSLLQLADSASEELVVLFAEFRLHAEQVGLRQGHQLGVVVVLAPDGEAALLVRFMPVLQFGVVLRVARAAALVVMQFLAFLFEAGRDYVNDAEVGTIDDLQEGLAGVLGEDIVARAVLEEVDVRDLVALVEDVLQRRSDDRLEERANPRDEALLLAFEEINLLIDLLVDVQRDQVLEVERQILDEF